MEDEEEKERFRVVTLLKIRQTSVDMEPKLWLATQEARCVLLVCIGVVSMSWHRPQDERRAVSIIRLIK